MNRIALVAMLLPAWAHAHDGHGLVGPHWHATDAVGFVVAIGAGALAWWVRRK